MAFTALISAYQESDEPGGPLRAVLPLAGRTLIERQVRLAALAGARRCLVLVERVPAQLLAAVDRLRRDGFVVGLARSAEEAAEEVDPDELLLLVADGFIGDESHLKRIVSAAPPVLLTVPDAQVDDRFERIDADSRWAGLALVDGALLRDTARMLNDWDPQSTLLRRAVQADARMLAVRADAGEARFTIAERAVDLGEVHRSIVDRAGTGRGDWISFYLLGPLERLATRHLMETGATPMMVACAATVLTAFAAIAFAWPMKWIGLILMIVATPLDGIADRLARLRLEEGIGHSWWALLLPLLAGAGLIALGFDLQERRGWGTILLVAATILFLLAQRYEVEGRAIPGLIFLAERKGLAWLMLPFAIAGYWLPGLIAMFAYAVASFFWAQHAVHADAPVPEKD